MGNLRADIPVPSLRTPPLGGAKCPDTFWNGGRGLTLHGPTTFLGPRWVFTASLSGQPAVSPGPPPPLPPGIPQGAMPFTETAGTVEVAVPPAGTPEGSVAFAEETP
jgi:hypothetical protein